MIYRANGEIGEMAWKTIAVALSGIGTGRANVISQTGDKEEQSGSGLSDRA